MSGGAVAPYAFRWPTIRSRSTLPETARYDGVEEVLERNIRWAASKSTRNLFRRKSNARRAVAFKSFGPDNNMQLYNRGIRRRLAPGPMCILPGKPVLRYGDEIGMGGNLSARAQLPAVRKEVLCGADLL